MSVFSSLMRKVMPALSVVPGLGTAASIGSMMFAKKEGRKDEKKALLATAYGTPAPPPGKDPGASMMTVGSSSPVGGPTPGGDGPYPPGSDQEGVAFVSSMILNGASDQAVYKELRRRKISQERAHTALAFLWQIAIPNSQTGKWEAITLSSEQKWGIANEIEKAFQRYHKGHKRSVIPKSLKRMVKQMQFMRKFIGVAHSVHVKGGRFKKKTG